MKSPRDVRQVAGLSWLSQWTITGNNDKPAARRTFLEEKQ